MIKKNKSSVVSIWSAMVSRFCIRPNIQEVDFENSPSDHETWSTPCHGGIHVDLHPYGIPTPLVPQA